ncbi:ATP-binding protein [Dactylosporangium sp. NPDC050688]|uniref:ATP-binding protein n=1 Tax=Dactylosporangium sp. NPDC050688 TaxID=3157217 RepID=UPI0033C3206A
MKFFKRMAETRAMTDVSLLLDKEARDAHRLPIVYGSDDFFVSTDAAWCGYAIPPKPWGFLPEKDRLNYYYSGVSIFDRMLPSAKDNACHLLVTNRVHSADEWQRALLERYARYATRAFAGYVADSRNAIERSEFWEQDVYLFVRMGARGNRGGLIGSFRDAMAFFASGAGIDDSQPDADEIEFWGDQATALNQALQTSWLRARPIGRTAVEGIVRHLDTPAQPTPDIAPADDSEWSIGKWRTVLASFTEEVPLGQSGKDRYNCVKFTTPTGTGTSYAAFLVLSYIPDHLHYSQNWTHHATSLDFPVDMSIRFEIIDPERAEKDLERPIWAAEAQFDEDVEAGYKPDEATLIQQSVLRDVKTRVRMGRTPLTYWQATLCVSDVDKEVLMRKVVTLIRHYRDIHFELVCPPLDQRELFYQSLPGSDLLIADWLQRTDASYLAAGMPWLTSTVGDNSGTYQGHTVLLDANGTLQPGVPVFFDLQNVADDDDRAPTEVVTGFPGSGKTVSRGLKVALEDALRGVTQFIWDPKGDFRPLYEYANEMHLDPEKVRLIDLLDPKSSISLDAFAIADVDHHNLIDERETLALEVLSALCSEYVHNPAGGLTYANILGVAVQVVLQREARERVPATMRGVVEILTAISTNDYSDPELAKMPENRRRVWQEHADLLVRHLNRVERSTLGRLFFRDPGESGTMRIVEGTMTVFIAIGLRTSDVTTSGTQPAPSLTNIISDVLSGLMVDYIRSLLSNMPHWAPKSAVFDEWHVIKRTSRAEALGDWLRRMGRSRRCSVRQMSQSAKDVDSGSLSAAWCGLCVDEDEARAACHLLGIEPSDTNLRMLMNLGKGEFLFRDPRGRVARVKVDIWSDWLLDKFNTQAVSKERRLATNPVTTFNDSTATVA